MSVDFMLGNLLFNFASLVASMVILAIVFMMASRFIEEKSRKEFLWNKAYTASILLLVLWFLYATFISGTASPKVTIDSVYIPDGTEIEQQEVVTGIELINSPTKDELSKQTAQQEKEQNIRIKNSLMNEE